jgi:putative transposase
MPYWRLFYHVAFATHKREPLIAPQWEACLHNVIAGKARDLEAMVYAVGGMEDHVHLVASVPPRISVATFIGQVKGSSSHFVNHSLDLESQFAWQGGYGVVSFSGKALDEVVRYVKNQRRHHAERTLMAMLERTTAEAGVRGAEPPR